MRRKTNELSKALLIFTSGAAIGAIATKIYLDSKHEEELEEMEEELNEKYSKKAVKIVEEVIDEINEEVDPYTMMVDAVKEITNSNELEPYFIREDEFVEEGTCEKIYITYLPYTDMYVNDELEPIEDLSCIGKECMREIAKVENDIYYVRNSYLGIDYEISVSMAALDIID